MTFTPRERETQVKSLRRILKESLREQAFVKAEGRTVHVTFYGHRHDDILNVPFLAT